METDYSLLAPGPVNLHPEVLKILGLPMIHHRTPFFEEILRRSLLNLQRVFQTQEQAFILPSTGSGGMESLLVNPLSPGDEVLAIVSGKFGERWSKMAQTFGLRVTEINLEWGKKLDLALVEKELQKNSKFKAVLCQACETSTGIAHPIQDLGGLISNYPDTLFLVDAITALGAYPIPMDMWKIDGMVGGSQKAFMLPTGLSFVSFSKKAWKKIEASTMPRFYFDIRREKKANLTGETFFSSPVSLIRALDWVLQDLLARGLDHHFKIIEKRSLFTKHFVHALGLQQFSETPSTSLTALVLPPNVDGQKLRAHLEQTHLITLMGGQDQLKGKILRIGHMGFIPMEEMVTFFLKLQKAFREFNVSYSGVQEDEMRAWLQK